MAQPATNSNVLTTLDERAPTAFYWQLTLLATLGGFLFGYDTSNIGSALNFVPYHLHGLALGYLVSGASLGAAAGAILGGPASDHFGRKSLLVVDAGIYAAGAILSAVTPDAAVLLVARTHDRAGHRRGLRDRHRLHRRVRAEGPARVADHAAAVDDHGRHPHLLHRRADHLQRVPGQRGLGRLAAGARPGRRPGPDRAGAAYPDAGVAPVAAAARPLRRRAQGAWPHSARGRSARTTSGAPRRSWSGSKAEAASSGAGPGPRGAPGAGRGLRVLHLPADHRHQRAAVLRAAPARADLLRAARLAGGDHRGRRRGHRDHDGRQRGRDLSGLPLDRQVRPQAALHGRLHRHDRVRAGRGGRAWPSCPGRRGWWSS